MAARPPVPPPPPPSPAERRAGGSIALGAAAYAAAELAAAVVFGGFFESGRAEAGPFLASRPWLLLAAAAATARLPLRRRALLYAAALLLAALSETLLLLRLGARDPWPEMLRGLSGGTLIAVTADLLAQAGRRWLGRWGRWAAAAAAALLLLLPGALRPYEGLVKGAPDAIPGGTRPSVMLMTGLPLVWGETGAFDPASRPAAAYVELQKHFSFQPVDVLDPSGLARGRLLFLAQPQRLAPAELAALDAWVRRGGMALILADPALVWPSELPPGDIRRPPPASLLEPLLEHWGMGLEEADPPGIAVEPFGAARLAMAAPGRFVTRGRACRVKPGGRVARCDVGRGTALLLADADLMRDALWTAPGESGGERSRRTADNPLILADMLDLLAGLDRPRPRVAWADPAANRGAAVALALLPVAACGGITLLPRRRRRR